MNIIQAKDSDLISVLFVVKQCLKAEQGLLIWEKPYYDSELTKKIQKDIEDQNLFLYRKHESCIALLALNREQSNTYQQISQNDKNTHFLSIQCLAIHPHWQQKDIAKELFHFAETFSVEHGYSSLQFMTSNTNEQAIKLFEDAKFILTSHQTTEQNTPYCCYEKILQ